MKQKILEGNLLIAKFMNCYCEGQEPKFDYDWSWSCLMPVVTKIITHRYEDGDTAHFRTFGMTRQETGQVMVRINRHTLFECPTLIQATYEAVVDFIIWYNQQEGQLLTPTNMTQEFEVKYDIKGNVPFIVFGTKQYLFNIGDWDYFFPSKPANVRIEMESKYTPWDKNTPVIANPKLIPKLINGCVVLVRDENDLFEDRDEKSKSYDEQIERYGKLIEILENKIAQLSTVKESKERYSSEQIISDLEKRLYNCGLDNAKLIGKITELKEQCLEDRGSDAIAVEDVRKLYDGTIQNVGTSVKRADMPTFDQWLADYKFKNKQHH